MQKILERKLFSLWFLKLIVFVSSIFFLVFSVQAEEVLLDEPIEVEPQIYHSTTVGGDWSDPATWVENSIPTENDFVEIYGDVEVSSDVEIFSIYIDLLGRLSSFDNYSMVSHETIENQGFISDEILVKSGNGFNNLGIFEGVLTPFGSQYQSFTGVEEVHLNLDSDIYVASDLSIKNLNSNNFRVFFEDSVERNFSIKNILDNTDIEGDVILTLEGGEDLKGQTIKVQNLVINGTYNGIVVDYVVENLTINNNSSLIYQLTYPTPIYFHGNVTNNGTIQGRVSLHSFGDIINNGILSIENVVLDGGQVRSVLGLDKMLVVLAHDVLISNDNLDFSVLFPGDHRIDFINNGNVRVRNIIGQNNNGFYTNGDVTLDQAFGLDYGYRYPVMLLGTLEANRVFIDDTIHFYTSFNIFADLIVNINSILQIYSNYNNQEFHIYGNILNNGHISNSQKMYIHKSIENNGIWEDLRKRTYLAWNESSEGQYEFKINDSPSDLGEIISLVDPYFARNTKSVIDMISDGDIQYWRSRPIGGDWSDIYTINVPLYLEDNPTFFTLSEIIETVKNEEVELTITAEDLDYSGPLYFSVAEGSVTPNEASMENGTLTLMLSFDTVSEDNLLSVTSENLSGTSNQFNVVSAENPNFFIFNDIPNTKEDRNIIITVNAEDPAHTGTLEIIHNNGVAIPDIEMIEGAANFSVVFPDPFSNNNLLVRDKENNFLSGISNDFIVSRKSRGGSNSNNNEDTENQTNDEQEYLPPDEELENTPIGEGEPDEPVEEEPEFLLENECLGIQSELAVLRIWNSDRNSNRKLQQKLRDLNFLEGRVDGDFGPATKKALEDFQEQNGLGTDGIFGNESSEFIDSNCNNLEDKTVNELELNETEDEQEEQDEDENIFEEIGNWIENTWDGLGNWFSGLFGGDDDYQIVSGEIEGPELPRPEDEYITKEMLRQAFNLNVDQDIVNEINRLMPLYEINTIERQAHFLSQVAHESGLKNTTELDFPLSFWKNHKPRKFYPKLWTDPEYFVNQEKKLNYVYYRKKSDGTYYLGNTQTTDGYKYRGRGIMQITGRNNYINFTNIHNLKNKDDEKDFVKNPELLLQNKYGTEAAFWFWEARNINSVANDNSRESIVRVTQLVNGDTIGIDSRVSAFNKIYNILNK